MDYTTKLSNNTNPSFKMAREEEIRQVASAYAIDEVKDTCNPASKRGLLNSGFIDGAEWADAHNEGLNMHIKFLKEELIDKACEWLVRELCYTARGINLFNNKAATDEFVELFKQAMKGE